MNTIFERVLGRKKQSDISTKTEPNGDVKNEEMEIS